MAWSKQFKLLQENFNPAEPRIEKGNEGGGRWTDMDSIFHNEELKAAEEKMSRIMPTNFFLGYGGEEWQKNRVFVINGEKVVGYDAAIEKFEEEAEKYAGERVKKDRQAFIILGPPGAGKSTWKTKICKIYGTSCPDVDDIKKTIPEYSGGVGANAVHEESCDIGAEVVKKQLEKGNNIVLEKIGCRKSTINALITVLKERNYEVHLLNVDVPIETAMERMLKRFHETGRFVPLDYMRKVDHNPSHTFSYLKTIRGIDSYVKIDKKNHLEGKGEIYKALSTKVGWRGTIREEISENFEETKTHLSLRKFRIHREDVEFEKKHPRVPGGPKGGEFTNKTQWGQGQHEKWTSIPIHNKFEKTTYDNAAKLAKEYPAKNKFKVGDTVAYTPPLGAPGIPLTKGKVYTIKAVDNVAGVIHLDNEWMLPSSYMSIAKDKDLTKEEKPEFKVGDIVQSPQKTKYKITKVDGGLAFGFLLYSDGKPSHETEIALASMSYLQSAGYKVVDSELPTLADIIKPIKKFKVTHAERPDIPQVFNVGDKVSFRGKMYFVKYVNPKDKMVQIELAKIRHGKVLGVVTGAIVNVKPDTIFPWGSKPNNKAIQVGGDEWNQKTAVRLEYDYAKVKPLLEKIAAQAVGGKTKVKIKKTWDDLDSQMQTDIEEKWKSENYDKELEYQRQNYYEEEALSDAKSKVADDFNDGTKTDWADEALTDYIVSRIDDGLPKIPFTAEQLSKSMSITAGKYNDFANEDAEVEFDNKELMNPHGFNKDQLALPGFKNKEPHEYLTDEMRKGLSDAILATFVVVAQEKSQYMEPPSYLEQQAQESIDDSWSQMDDDEKYKWAKENSIIDSEETSEGELDALPTKFDPLNETTGADYQRTQKLAKLMSVERAAQLLVERGLMNDIDTARTQIKNIDERLWHSWKDSSTTENGKILQVAAADELGGRFHEYDGLKKHESIKDANRKFKDIGGFDGVKAYLRGKWETTQYLLDKAGIQTMKVYRNISWDVPFMGSRTQKLEDGYIRFPNAVVSRNGCQACTTDPHVANGWGGNIVFRVSAPRTAALSIPAYGINVHTEHECVMAGTAWQAYDVWNKPAPTFEEFPLDTSHMAEKMFTSPDSPYMPKIKTDLLKLLSKKGLYSGKSDAYWKKYGSQGLEDKFKPGNKVKWDYPGNDPDNVYTVVGKNDYGIKLKNSQGTNLQAKPEDLTILSNQIDLKKDGLDKKPKFSSGDKISGVSGSNFADTEFTVNSVNRNGTMDVTSEYGTPYAGVKPHLFQTSTKTKEEPKSFTATTTIGKDKGKEVEYKVGDLVKGGISGNIYKIDKIGDTSVHFIVQKVSNTSYGPASTVGGGHQDTITSLGSVYKKVEPEKPKMDSTFKTSEKYQKSLDKFKVGQTVYSQYQPGKGYVITGFMKNGDLDTKEINLKTGNPTDHYAQLVPDLIYTSKEDAKKSPESNWGKDD